MVETFKLPQELTYVPKPFVVLTGLNITHNAIHQSIWDAFVNNRRQNRVPINLACLPGDHAYPKSKTKRTSYDWYIPKGLLKTGWMNKHLNQVPAVVAIFIELDWDDPAWQERHQACASRIQVVRASLQGRNTKLAVVLLQNQTPIPPGDDPGSSAVTRANALCSACELSAKSLFVLPITEHVLGYVTRLEGAFFELAQSYYHAECRQIEAHKDFLNKTTHQLLFPRHQFKIAFFHEMVQDPGARRKALKHYIQCYLLIQELRSYDTNNLEIKLIAGFVNYKICQLSFLHLDPPAPLDAISQFRRHIDHFKPRHGSTELLFEHSAWLCHQFTLFGELFELAINDGLSAIQTQHPGFYFYQAARYARGRKAFAANLCKKLDTPYPADDPLHTEKLEFYGQRPWRQGQQRIDPPDIAREHEGILALQLQEATFDHSSQVITLLTQAVQHVKKFKSSRLRLSLTVQTAEEYFFSGDYLKAIVLLKRAITDYAIDNWSVPLAHTLTLALQSAYLVGDVETFVTLCVCAISRGSGFEMPVKEGIQNNLYRVLSSSAPIYSDLPKKTALAEAAKVMDVEPVWQSAFTSCSNVTLNMNKISSFIDCKVSFSSNETPISCQANIHVFVKVACPLPVKFSELTLGFQDHSYDIQCQAQNDDCVLDCEPGKIASKEFKFPLQGPHMKKILSVTSLSLKLGSATSKAVKFLWQWPEAKPSDVPFSFDSSLLKQTGMLWNNIPTCQSTLIVERPPKLKLWVEHASPVLANEVYPITLHLQSNEDGDQIAKDIKVVVTLRSELSNRSFLYKELSFGGGGHVVLTQQVSELDPGDEQQVCVYLVSCEKGSLDIDITVTYNCDTVKCTETGSNISCSSTIVQQLNVDVCYAFEFTTSLVSSTLQSISHLKLNEPFIYMINVKPATKWPIIILSSKSEPNLNDENFKLTFADSRMPSNIKLSQGEVAVDCFQALLSSASSKKDLEPSNSFGGYAIQWKRANVGADIPAIWTRISLPSLPFQHLPISVSMRSPPFGVLHQKVPIRYRIYNSTEVTCSVEIRLEPADSFTFSGNKCRRALILPCSEHYVPFNLFPLAVGYRALPRFSVKITQHERDHLVGKDQQPQNDIDHSQLMTHLYVKPATLLAQA